MNNNTCEKKGKVTIRIIRIPYRRVGDGGFLFIKRKIWSSYIGIILSRGRRLAVVGRVRQVVF